MRFVIIVLFFSLLISNNVLFAAAVQLEGSSRVLEVRGANEDDYLGRPIACADLDNDGADDIIVGADISDFYGTESHPLYIFKGRGNFSGNDLIDLASENADAVIYGETGSMDFANSLAGGDVNNDGIADLIMADSTFSPSGRTGAGVVYVLFGRVDFFTNPTRNFQSGDWDLKILGAQAGSDTGGAGMAPFAGATSHALATGDVNHDGICDMVIGAHYTTVGTKNYAGIVSIVFGRQSFSHGQTIDLLSQASAVIQGNEQDAELGTDIDTGDINGDGIEDIVMGEGLSSEGLWSSEGKVFAVWGRASFPATMSISSANLTIWGKTKGDELGDAVCVSDVNGDGIGDLIALATGWDHTNSSSIDEGGIYGFFGRTDFPASIDLGSRNADFFVEGYNVENSLYWAIDGADFNGDGFGDFMFTSRDGERPGYDAEGRTFLILGKTPFPTSYSVESENFDYILSGGVNYLQLCDTFSSGDTDGDGADEILLGAPFVDSSKGRLFVFDLNPRLSASPLWNLYE
jgi:hypothetical protein